MHKMCILNNPGCAQKSLKSEGGAGGEEEEGGSRQNYANFLGR